MRSAFAAERFPSRIFFAQHMRTIGVHPFSRHPLHRGGVPQLVMSFGRFQLPLGIDHAANIRSRFRQRATGRWLCALEAVLVGMEAHQVHRKFPAR